MQEPSVLETSHFKYKAFISYSHAADGKLAPALQSALHRFAKPWYRLRAMRIFRDKTSLAMTPELWPSIEKALTESEYFLLLASPQAAQSQWVQQEVDWWLQHRSANTLFIVITDGDVFWDCSAGDFDWNKTTALTTHLKTRFKNEPLYVDLRWARSEEKLSLRHLQFRATILDIAAPLHGKAKDELDGEDVREYRKAKGLAWTAFGLILSFAVTAVWQALVAREQRDEAKQQRDVAVARQLAAQSTSILTQLPDELPLSVLLAIESTRYALSFEGNQALRSGLSILPSVVAAYPYEGPDANRARIRALVLSANGNLAAVGREDGIAEVLDMREGKAIVSLLPEENAEVASSSQVGGMTFKASGVDAEVTALAFSPDGRILITGSNDKTARIWEVSSGRELFRLIHEGGVASVAFNPAGTYVAAGSKDGTARIASLDQGREVMTFTGQAEIRKVLFSPSGTFLAGISTDGNVSLWDMATGQVHRAWSRGETGLGLAFSPDGKKLATASGNVASVWDVETGEELFYCTHETSAAEGVASWIWDVAFSPDGEYIATAGRDGTARVWNLTIRQEVVRLKHAAPVEAVAFSPDSATLSTASFDGTARLWDFLSGRERLRAVHPGGAEVVSFSPDGSRFASGGLDGSVTVWNIRNGDQTARMVHPDKVTAVGFSPDGNLIATGSKTAERRATVWLWNPDGTLQSPPTELPRILHVDQLIFSEDGTYMTARWNSYVFSMKVRKGRTITDLPQFRNSGSLALNPRYLAAWDREHRSLRLWETAGARELPLLEVDNLWKLAFDSTGAFLAGIQTTDNYGNGVVHVWALPNWQKIGSPIRIQSARKFALSAGGQYLAMEVSELGQQKFSHNYFVNVWDVATSQRVAQLPHAGEIASMTFHPQGKRLFIIAQPNEVQIWELPGGMLKARLKHEREVQALRFSTEESIVATISEGHVYIWDYSTGKVVSQLPDAGYVKDVRFNPNGRSVLTGSVDGTAVVWLWKTEDMRNEACKRLSRNLTEEEWRQYLGEGPYRKTCPNLP